jgi:hypothetical protein
MKKLLLVPVLLFAPLLSAQQEGPTPTQALITLDSKTPPKTLTPQNLTLKVNNREAALTSINPVRANRAQVAILIDDGLRTSFGRNLGDLKTWVSSFPPGTEIFIGYMQSGRVTPAQPFTTDYAAAANSLRLPLGTPGLSASPYFCLSDFVKRWPAEDAGKARFVLMLTNGVDPYNGSTDISNQNSPYVSSAVTDAQRAAVAVYSIYYSDAGFGGDRSSFSGQSYLQQVAEGTGGQGYFQGLGNPVSLTPFLDRFRKAIAETYVATFNAPGNKELVPLKVSTNLSGTKVRSPQQVRPGTQILGTQNTAR